MRRTRYIILVFAAVVTVAGCGKDKDCDIMPENSAIWHEIQSDSDMQEDRELPEGLDEELLDQGAQVVVSSSEKPLFTGDALEFFGLNYEEAIYRGGLEWLIKIDGLEYQICPQTSDNRTIESVEVNLVENYGVEKEFDLGNNFFSYDEDLHDLEPQYWE